MILLFIILVLGLINTIYLSYCEIMRKEVWCLFFPPESYRSAQQVQQDLRCTQSLSGTCDAHRYPDPNCSLHPGPGSLLDHLCDHFGWFPVLHVLHLHSGRESQSLLHLVYCVGADLYRPFYHHLDDDEPGVSLTHLPIDFDRCDI